MHTVALHAPTAISKIRRYEETKLSCGVHAAGLPAGNWEHENRRSKPHAIECGLDLRFSRSQTREARGGGRHAAFPAGAAGASRLACLLLLLLLLRFFGTSILRR